MLVMNPATTIYMAHYMSKYAANPDTTIYFQCVNELSTVDIAFLVIAGVLLVIGVLRILLS